MADASMGSRREHVRVDSSHRRGGTAPTAAAAATGVGFLGAGAKTSNGIVSGLTRRPRLDGRCFRPARAARPVALRGHGDGRAMVVLRMPRRAVGGRAVRDFGARLRVADRRAGPVARGPRGGAPLLGARIVTGRARDDRAPMSRCVVWHGGGDANKSEPARRC